MFFFSFFSALAFHFCRFINKFAPEPYTSQYRSTFIRVSCTYWFCTFHNMQPDSATGRGRTKVTAATAAVYAFNEILWSNAKIKDRKKEKKKYHAHCIYTQSHSHTCGESVSNDFASCQIASCSGTQQMAHTAIWIEWISGVRAARATNKFLEMVCPNGRNSAKTKCHRTFSGSSKCCSFAVIYSFRHSRY